MGIQMLYKGADNEHILILLFISWITMIILFATLSCLYSVVNGQSAAAAVLSCPDM